jgi:heme iron utilization protein
MTDQGRDGGGTTAATDARYLMKAARSCALGTLDAVTGAPYVSLVTVALDADGIPVVLISRLARHTRNIEADPRASLLFTPVATAVGDTLALARLTVMGRLLPTARPTARSRFLAVHPDANVYAGFTDFGFFALTVERAHFIGGFGRIIDIPPNDLAVALSQTN